MRVIAKRVTSGDVIAYLDPEGYIREIAKMTRSKVIPEITDELDKWQADWTHKTDFGVRVSGRGDEIITYIFPKGENKKYWTWTSRGTDPHEIPPGEKGFLAFLWDGVRGNYNPSPKTFPEGAVVGSGPVDWVYTQQPVDHPGTKPRHFEERTMREYKGTYSRYVRQATDAVRERRRKQWISKGISTV